MQQTPLTFALPPGATPALPAGVRLRRFQASDLEAAEALTRGVHWPHRLEDWRFQLAMGQAVVALNGSKLIATAVRWLWGERHACLGSIIVSQEWQGQRIGRHMMDVLMHGIEDRSLLLFATEEGRGLYERLGFRAVGEVRQHQGIALPAQVMALPDGMRLRPVGRSDAKTLVALDTQAAGMPRDKLIRQLLADGEAVVLARGNEAVGFSVLRRFGRGHQVGPVVAPDLQGAQALIGYWCSRQAGRFLRVDVDASSGLESWLAGLGLEGVASATPMARGTPPQRGHAHGGWALVSQALG